MQGMRPALHREELLRHLPFAAMALVGQVSALWPPGPIDVTAYRISTGLLVVNAVLIVRRPGRPERTWLVRAGVYITSLSFLMLAMGGINSGLGALLLVPVVGIALYGEIWESVVVTGFVLSRDPGGVSGQRASAGGRHAARARAGRLPGRHGVGRDPYASTATDPVQ